MDSCEIWVRVHNEIKRHLFPGRKVMTNLDSILKSRDITLSTKVHLVAMAPHSSTLAWKIPQTEEPGRLQSMGSWRVRHNWVTSLSCIGEGNGNPLQCSCLENPRDAGAWWAAVYGVAQSRTRLKWLSSSSNKILRSCKVCIYFSLRNFQNSKFYDLRKCKWVVP